MNIKLIASDLDGTLLQNGNQNITSKMFRIIETLHEKGILFVAASGRQYANLYRLFEPVSKDMAFICENGALVMYQDKILSKTSMDKEIALKIVEDIRNKEGCEVQISGENTSYIVPKSENFIGHFKNVLKNNYRIIKDPSDIPEDIIKVSVYEKAGIVENSGTYFINKWQDKVKCTVSGYGWLDFVCPTVNKGTALNELIKKLSITPEEVMAFGDNYNDLEMLSLVKYGYIMDNAVEDIKKRYSYHCSLVEKTLMDVFKLDNI